MSRPAPDWRGMDPGAFDTDAAGELVLPIPDRELAAAMRPDDDAGTMTLDLWGNDA